MQQPFKITVEDGYTSQKWEGKINLNTDAYQQTTSVYNAEGEMMWITFTRTTE